MFIIFYHKHEISTKYAQIHKLKCYTLFMKKFFIAVLVVLCLGIGWYLNIFDLFNKTIPVSERGYIAPSFYLHTDDPSRYSVLFDRKNYYIKAETFGPQKFVPEWTITESYERSIRTVALIQIVSTGDVPMWHEFENLDNINGYSILNGKRTSESANLVAWERIFAEKTLDKNPQYTVRIQIPFEDKLSSKFRNKEQALDFLKTFLPNLTYDEKALVEIADSMHGDENSRSWHIGSNDIDPEIVKKWPLSTQTTIWFSALQQLSLTREVQRKLDDVGIENFCKFMYDSFAKQNYTKPDNLFCNSDSKNVAFLLHIDDDATYCIDTQGNKKTYERKYISEKSSICE